MTSNMNLSLSLVREAYDNHVRPNLTGKRAKRADKVIARLMSRLEEVDSQIRAIKEKEYEPKYGNQASGI